MKNYPILIGFSLIFAASAALALPQRVSARRPSVNAAGPIEYVGAAVNAFSVTRSPTVNYPTVVENDIMIAVMTTDTPATYDGTPVTGWTLLHAIDDAASDTTTAVFWKRADSSEPGSDPWTNIMAATETGISVVVAFRNCKLTGSPFNQSATPVAGGSVTNHDCPTVTTTVDGCMVVGILGIDPGSATRTYTWDAGWDMRVGYSTTPSGVNGTSGAVYIGSDLQDTAAASIPGGDFNSAESATKFTYALEPQ